MSLQKIPQSNNTMLFFKSGTGNIRLSQLNTLLIVSPPHFTIEIKVFEWQDFDLKQMAVEALWGFIYK